MGLRESMEQDTVSGLALRPVLKVKPTVTLRQAARKMREHGLGCVIAVDSRGKPVGKFTERLLMRALLADARSLDDPIEKHMYPSASPVKLTDTVAEMVRTMQEGQLRFLCVVDARGKAVALTGQKGLMEYIADHFPRQVKVQRFRSKLHMDSREGA